MTKFNKVMVIVAVGSLLVSCGVNKQSANIEWSTKIEQSTNTADATEDIEITKDSIEWTSKNTGIKCVDDFSKLSDTMTKEEIDEILGIQGVIDEDAALNDITQYKYEYDDGNIIELALLDDEYHILNIKVASDIQFADNSVISTGANNLDLESTYKDYIDALGTEGILININGWLTRTYLWVNSEGAKLEATFNTRDGTINHSYNYF